MNKVFLVLGIFLFWTGIEVFGQVQDSVFIETVEVRASRLGLTQKEMSKSATIITQQQIASLPIQSIDDVLRFVPGVELQSRFGFGVQSDITMRGSNFNQVIVLVDGIRQNDPLTGHFNGNLPVVIDEIEQIEVIRGPASAIFGADAVGGVINIVTKKSLDKNLVVRADLGGGQFGYQKAGGFIGLRLGKFQPFFGIETQKSDGQEIDESVLKTFFETQIMTYGLGIDFSENVRMKIRSSIDERNFNAQWFYTRSTFDLSRERVKQYDSQLTLDAKHKNKASTKVLLSYQTTQDSFIFNPAFSPNIHETDRIDAQVTHTRQWNRFKLNVGVQGDIRSIESTDRGNHNDTHIGAYTTGIYEFTNGFKISGAMRLDQDDNYGLQWSPQFGLSYLKGKVKWRANFGRSVRAADYTERYISRNIPGILSSGRNLGNADLLAETSWSSEVGADIYFNDGLSFSATGFHRRGKNLIDFILTPATEILDNEKLDPEGSYFLTQNISELTTIGFELLPTLVLVFDGHTKLRYQGGVTFMKSTIPGSEDLASKYLANHADITWQQNIAVNSGSFGFSIQTSYKKRDADRVDMINKDLKASYFVINGRAHYNILGDMLQVYVHGLNLTDVLYSDILGAQMPRSWFIGGVRFRL